MRSGNTADPARTDCDAVIMLTEAVQTFMLTLFVPTKSIPLASSRASTRQRTLRRELLNMLATIWMLLASAWAFCSNSLCFGSPLLPGHVKHSTIYE